MNDLHVSLIQTSVYWENIEKNLHHFSEKINEIEGATDLIVLPEMFPTGFTMNTEEFAQEMSGEVVHWMKKNAQEKNSTILGSVIIKENGKYFNRLIAAMSDQSIKYYDKRHLFRMAEEHHFFSAGNQKVIIELKGWKINLLVCYDLRFPVWSRNAYQKKSKLEVEAAYDVAIYVANWPEARVSAWDTLLKARAIENQSYVLGVNRIGNDGSGIQYNGSSQAIDPKGQIISKAQHNEDKLIQCELSYEDLQAFRKKFPVGLDAD